MALRFTTEAVFIETFTKDASVDTCRALFTVVKHAFVAERFTMDAVFIDAFVKEASVDT